MGMDGRMAGLNRAIRSKLPSEAHDWIRRPLVAAALGATAPWNVELPTGGADFPNPARKHPGSCFRGGNLYPSGLCSALLRSS